MPAQAVAFLVDQLVVSLPRPHTHDVHALTILPPPCVGMGWQCPLYRSTDLTVATCPHGILPTAPNCIDQGPTVCPLTSSLSLPLPLSLFALPDRTAMGCLSLLHAHALSLSHSLAVCVLLLLPSMCINRMANHSHCPHPGGPPSS
jgi:hypothetical protein